MHFTIQHHVQLVTTVTGFCSANERNTLTDVLGFLSGLVWLPIVLFVLAIVVVVFIVIRAGYKIADANQALVITGGKGAPRILVGGGAFVPPLRKGEFFDLGLKTVDSTNVATHTNTMIPVVVEWTAQLRVDTETDANGELNESVRNAILGFTNFEGKISDSLQQTLEGEVRAVVATMTPEDLVRNMEKFTEQVNSNVRDSMAKLGFKLVSLNIGKITDPHGYYQDLAAKDREEKRREASNLKANADQDIAVRNAETNEAAKSAEQKRDLALSEQDRALNIRKAQNKAEIDISNADAEIAGQLQRELRNQELTSRQGEVEVIRERQRKDAAIARREVEVTEAETAKLRSEIDAAATARISEIEAEAAAEAIRREAQGSADAAVRRAQGEADSINRTTEAHAKKVRDTGIAEAEVSKAKGEAEAAAILAKGSAEAETQRLMAEALAANEGANLQVTIAEIESRTRVTISTEMGKAMAEIGKNAKFIDMGGSSGQKGDLLTRVMGNVPELFNMLEIKNGALNGESFGDTLGTLLSSIKSNGKPPVGTAAARNESDATTQVAPYAAPPTLDERPGAETDAPLDQEEQDAVLEGSQPGSA